MAREIVKDYHGVYPNEDYYNGCSDGGREAMEMAERYPDDFNGIIAGAPESSSNRSVVAVRTGVTAAAADRRSIRLRFPANIAGNLSRVRRG
ncbi:MAG TPA: tannase/feruloyl esterase family alpha/beta hydrolase [Solirubrobacteraceae bacterium]|nr:tannase/feruloyl esterase family alpha/beta hydrolase [Solirubrobacteraceae bacterium]